MAQTLINKCCNSCQSLHGSHSTSADTSMKPAHSTTMALSSRWKASWLMRPLMRLPHTVPTQPHALPTRYRGMSRHAKMPCGQTRAQGGAGTENKAWVLPLYCCKYRHTETGSSRMSGRGYEHPFPLPFPPTVASGRSFFLLSVQAHAKVCAAAPPWVAPTRASQDSTHCPWGESLVVWTLS